jgi:hypothetical protein
MEYREYLLDDDTDSECLLNDDNEALMQQSKKNCATNSRNAKHERGCNFCRKIIRCNTGNQEQSET